MPNNDQNRDIRRIARMASDNFTPRTRTPWGGTRLAAMKGLDAESPLIIGESWEVSVEPSFPSFVDATGQELGQLIAESPTHWLGHDGALGNTSLLVKLLDTDDLLSLQVHPSDDYPALSAGESGKPESWYVVAAEAGAGIYLGLRENVTEAAMREEIANEGDLTLLLNFVEVSEGDFFVIAAGTPHAIGPGLTLVEPQRILPGRRGLTYRYWDWNRRYDSAGKQSEQGEPRELHIEDALAVTRFDGERGQAFVQQVTRRAGRAEPNQAASLTSLSDPVAPGALRFAPLSVAQISGTGDVSLPPSAVLRALTVVAGTIEVDGELIGPGQSLVLAAEGGDFTVQCSAAHAVLCAAHTD